ncbi:hypothetical protein RUND412_009663 [Rhizina undulata]
MLLGTTTRDFAERSGRANAELEDVRSALEHVGLLRPLNIYNDPNDDDTRAVDALIDWFRGPQAAEMRRVAGFGGAGSNAQPQTGLENDPKNDEWMASMRKVSEKRAAQ